MSSMIAGKIKAVQKPSMALRVIINITTLRKVLYDAIERVNITDGEHIEILWKFNDLFEAV